jgi:hypothetical protein
MTIESTTETLDADWGQISWNIPSPTFPGGLIYGKLIEAARLMEGVEKGGYNSAQKFKFRGIEQLTQACAPIFKEVGIVVVPQMRVVADVPQPDKGHRVMIEASYSFYAEDGSYVTATTVGEGVDGYDKGGNKAMSAAFKYALLQTLCIGDPEDDSDSHSEPKPARKAAKPAANNEVSAADWAAWETKRAQLLADDALKAQFAEWVGGQDFKPERSISAVNFEKLTGMADLLLSADGAPFE